MYKAYMLILLCWFIFLILFLSLWWNQSWYRFWGQIFLFVFDVSSCILEYFKTILVAITRAVCTVIPLSSFHLTLSVQNTFLMVYSNIWRLPLPSEDLFGLFQSARQQWNVLSFFNVYCLSRPWHRYITTFLPMPRGR